MAKRIRDYYNDEEFDRKIKARIQKRECLKCGRMFRSENSGNRICTQCKSNNKGYYHDAFSGAYHMSRKV
jgi:hypothetical protein